MRRVHWIVVIGMWSILSSANAADVAHFGAGDDTCTGAFVVRTWKNPTTTSIRVLGLQFGGSPVPRWNAPFDLHATLYRTSQGAGAALHQGRWNYYAEPAGSVMDHPAPIPARGFLLAAGDGLTLRIFCVAYGTITQGAVVRVSVWWEVGP